MDPSIVRLMVQIEIGAREIQSSPGKGANPGPMNPGGEFKLVLEVLNLNTLEKTQTELFLIVSRSF